MTHLYFYQGLRTIGGTVAEVRTPSARCLFDFGLSSENEVSPGMVLRPDRLVTDFLRLQCIPPVRGIYSRSRLGDEPIPAWEDGREQVFFLLSHMHIDHMGVLGLLAEEIPVYMTEESLALYRALCGAGLSAPAVHGNCVGVRCGEQVTVGGITFEAVPVDHDVPGACGFLITTPDGNICYTGDMRLHGFHGDRTLAFARRVSGCDVCITEGVTAGFIEDFDAVVPSKEPGPEGVTEEDVLKRIAGAVRQAKGAVFLNTYNRNLERMERMPGCIESAGRTLVLTGRQAYLLEQVSGGTGLWVYEPFARSFPQKLAAALVTREELQSRPERYVLELPYASLLETLDFDPASCLYIHANGAPLGPFDPNYERMVSFLNRRGIPLLELGTGGHAAPGHLKYILGEIAPKVLIPLHSMGPEKIRIPGSRQLLPQIGVAYRLADHGLEED